MDDRGRSAMLQPDATLVVGQNADGGAFLDVAEVRPAFEHSIRVVHRVRRRRRRRLVLGVDDSTGGNGGAGEPNRGTITNHHRRPHEMFSRSLPETLEPRLTVRAIRPLVSGLRQSGYDATRILAAVGIDEATLRDPDGRVPTSVA